MSVTMERVVGYSNLKLAPESLAPKTKHLDPGSSCLAVGHPNHDNQHTCDSGELVDPYDLSSGLGIPSRTTAAE